MNNVLLFLGNGFDLDLGLKTRYKDFYESKWKTFSALPCVGLKQYIEKRKKIDKWFDLECIMSDYVYNIAKENNIDVELAEIDQKFFSELCDIMGDYINEAETKGRINHTCLSQEILKLVHRCHGIIYTLNYTRLKRIGNRLDINILKNDYVHLHGDVASPILGISRFNDVKIPKQYFNWIKSSQNGYKCHNVSQDLLNAEEIIFFGLCFGVIDCIYFKEFFNAIIKGEMKSKKNISIITYDQKSKEDILYQLYKMDIYPDELFAKSNLSFIYTDSSICNESFEEKDNLISRLKQHISSINLFCLPVKNTIDNNKTI